MMKNENRNRIATNADKKCCMSSGTFKQDETDLRSETKKCHSIAWNHDAMSSFLLKNKTKTIASIHIVTMTRKTQI